jgi:hypothetical protein
VFCCAAVAAFWFGFYGMVELSTNDRDFLPYLALALFLTPALLVYPLIRLLVGEGKPVLTAVLAALFGGLFSQYVQSRVKSKTDKRS